MNIKFNKPPVFPAEYWISYDVKTMWRPDGKKIGEILTLEMEFYSEGYSAEECFSIFKAILETNPSLSEASIKLPVECREMVVLRFEKQGDFVEQDPETCEVQFLPDDPIEWLGAN